MVETEARLLSASAVSVTKHTKLGNLLPMERFLLALKAPETKRQYPKRLESYEEPVTFV